MIPLWAISGIAAGVISGIAGYGLASRLADAKMARAEAGWANERTIAAQKASAAMTLEIEAHNATQSKLDALNGRTEELTVVKAQAARADAAASAARTSERRMLGSLEINRLVTAAAIEAAGATVQCAAYSDALSLRDKLLGDYRAKAQELGEFGREVSGAFELQAIAHGKCSQAYELVR